ncbi:hypothetical protein ACFLQY_00830 [Verrucomicrobiota bacterium]
MSSQYVSGSFRKYGMVSAFALCAVLGMVDHSMAASMDTYNDALAGGNAKASAVEAMQILEGQSLNGGASAEEVMKVAEQLMTGAVATGDERAVKWVSAAILKGAGEKNFDAAELGIRVVVEGSRYQEQVSQVTAEARSIMGISAPAAPAVEAPALASEEESFLAGLFDINRSSWEVSNRLSVGHDSNIYSDSREKSGMVYRDALSLSLSASSARTAAQVSYKPTLTVSPNKKKGDVEVYQDFIGMLSHELSERSTVRFKDTFKFQEDEDATVAGDLDDNSYWKNTAELSLDRVMRDNARLSVSASSTFKRYSESDAEVSDYELFKIGTSYKKDLSERTFGSAGLDYSCKDFDKSADGRGDSTVFVSAGVNHQVNPDVLFSVTGGASFVDPDGAGTDDKVVPYVNGQVTYYFSPRTTLTGLVKYYYNEDVTESASVGSESLRFELNGRHSFTEKISLDAKVGRSENTYSVEFITVGGETETTYTDFGTKLTYEINRVHAVDAGYKFRKTDRDNSADYDRHQFDLGWTVKF